MREGEPDHENRYSGTTSDEPRTHLYFIEIAFFYHVVGSRYPNQILDGDIDYYLRGLGRLQVRLVSITSRVAFHHC